MNELLVFFKGGRLRATLSAQPVFSSGIASLALLQDGLGGIRKFVFGSVSCFTVSPSLGRGDKPFAKLQRKLMRRRTPMHGRSFPLPHDVAQR